MLVISELKLKNYSGLLHLHLIFKILTIISISYYNDLLQIPARVVNLFKKGQLGQDSSAKL